MNLWQRIAAFFTEWDGKDTSKTLALTIEDLRVVNSNHIELLNLRREKEQGGWIPISSGILPDEYIGVDVTIMENDPAETTTTDAKRLRVAESWLQDERWIIKKSELNPNVIAWKPKSRPYQIMVEK